MRFYSLLIFCFLLFNCDPGATTKIEIVNNSSYDLKIKFIGNSEKRYWKLDDIEIERNKAITLKEAEIGPPAPDPNNRIEKILFINLYDLSIIKEITIKNLFVEINRKKIRWHEIAIFLLEITDELLLE